MQFLDKLVTSIVIQRLVPGRYSADNCGSSQLLGVGLAPLDVDLRILPAERAR